MMGLGSSGGLGCRDGGPGGTVGGCGAVMGGQEGAVGRCAVMGVLVGSDGGVL